MNGHEPTSFAEDTRPRIVSAAVRYLGKMETRPIFHLGDARRDRNVLEEVEVNIENARPRFADFTLDRNGFQLFEHTTALRDALDENELNRVYRPELERALLAVTGAASVTITDTVFVRAARQSPHSGRPGTTYPANHVHGDCSEKSGPAIARGALGARPESLLKERFAIYSLWRTFSEPPQDVPIALCDAQSVAPADEILADVIVGSGASTMLFEGMTFRHHPRHRWHYFRDMHRGELLVIKLFDSEGQRAWRVPHTGFTDPSAPAHAPPRLSVDVRAVAFFSS